MDPQDCECFDIAVGGSSPIKFWGMRGKNILCKYGAYGSDSPYELTSMIALSGTPVIIAGDAEGQRGVHIDFVFIFTFYEYLLFLSFSLSLSLVLSVSISHSLSVSLSVSLSLSLLLSLPLTLSLWFSLYLSGSLSFFSYIPSSSLSDLFFSL